MTQPMITGSWIDIVHPCPRDGVYWNRKTLAYSDDDWGTLVRHLKRDLGIDLLMIQGIAKDGLAVYPSEFLRQQNVRRRWYTKNCDDPLGAIVRACSKEDVDFYMGVGFLPEADSSGTVCADEQALEWYRGISEEVLAGYGDEPAFCGWYMAVEMAVADGCFREPDIKLARALTDIWKELTPDWPTIASPYFLGGNYRLQNSDANARMLEESGLDIIAYQDGVGVATAVQVPAPPDPDRNDELFAGARALHDRTDVALWANVESFCFENEIFFQPLIPASFERLRRQIENAAPHVDRIVSYTVPGLMTAQTVCPELGRPSTQELYDAYREYLHCQQTRERS